MPLTTEEWIKLTPEEQEARTDEKPEETPLPPEVKEDVVTFADGSTRPLKNLIGEITRKVKEEMRREAPPPREEPKTPPPKTDFIQRITTQAEDEMTRTGSTFPVNTILGLISDASRYHVSSGYSTLKKSNKVIKSTKRELKKQYKDFGDYEDEFDDKIDEADPSQITSEGLKLVFNAIRGSKMDEIITKIKTPPKEPTKIVGPSVGTGTGAAKGKVKLTPEQEKEMKDMGFDTEEDYLGRLHKYQDLARKKGLKVIPSLISERLILT